MSSYYSQINHNQPQQHPLQKPAQYMMSSKRYTTPPLSYSKVRKQKKQSEYVKIQRGQFKTINPFFHKNSFKQTKCSNPYLYLQQLQKIKQNIPIVSHPTFSPFNQKKDNYKIDLSPPLGLSLNSVKINAHKQIFILGKQGCGKTSLINCFLNSYFKKQRIINCQYQQISTYTFEVAAFNKQIDQQPVLSQITLFQIRQGCKIQQLFNKYGVPDFFIICYSIYSQEQKKYAESLKENLKILLKSQSDLQNRIALVATKLDIKIQRKEQIGCYWNINKNEIKLQQIGFQCSAKFHIGILSLFYKVVSSIVQYRIKLVQNNLKIKKIISNIYGIDNFSAYQQNQRNRNFIKIGTHLDNMKQKYHKTYQFIIVGFQNSGKSSLAMTMTKKNNDMNNICSKKQIYHHQTILVSQITQEAILNIYDFSDGIGKYTTNDWIPSFLCTKLPIGKQSINRYAILICFSLIDSYLYNNPRQFQHCISIMKNINQNIPIFIIGTKNDLFKKQSNLDQNKCQDKLKDILLKDYSQLKKCTTYDKNQVDKLKIQIIKRIQNPPKRQQPKKEEPPVQKQQDTTCTIF